jgi:DNA-binding CsgD family transcriptional regulator
MDHLQVWKWTAAQAVEFGDEQQSTSRFCLLDLHDITTEIELVESPEFVARLRKARNGDSWSVLTAREREILRLIAQSLTDREISEELHISHHTVSTHRKNLMRKLKASNVAGLVRAAVSMGLVAV